jgi:hypothetical protein
MELNTIVFFFEFNMVSVFIEISIELNLVELNTNLIKLNSFEYKLIELKLIFFHNFVELNPIKLFRKFNYEKTQFN